VMARLAAHAYATSFSAILLPRASQLPGASFWSGARLLRGLLLFGRLDTRLMQLALQAEQPPWTHVAPVSRIRTRG
jgi:hypothetical protein